jgi:hypothetical protein
MLGSSGGARTAGERQGRGNHLDPSSRISRRLNLYPLVRAISHRGGASCAGQRPSRRQFENIWLRTQRYDQNGAVRSGTGGVCYLYFPTQLSADQSRALARVGVN